MIYTLIFILLLFSLYYLLFRFYAQGWKNTPISKTTQALPHHRFTVIIPARNEEKNIQQCLESIIHNHYPTSHYEIIVIDDFSEDRTAKIVQDFSEIHSHIQLLQLKDYLTSEERVNAFKKEALNIAIHQAKYEWIITTDADCILPKEWILSYNSYLLTQPRAKFIAGPVNFIPIKHKNLLYYFQSIDFMTMQGITAASVQLNLGSMANGANLGFEKAVFFEVRGYEGIDHIASGDDMLLMQKIRNKYPNDIHYLKNQNSICLTYAQPTIASFLQQRIRWASKSGSYEEKKLQASLLLVYILNLSVLILMIVSLLNIFYCPLLLFGFILKMVIEGPFVVQVAQFFNKKNEFKWYLILQILHIIYIVLAGFLGFFGQYEWKGRQVK